MDKKEKIVDSKISYLRVCKVMRDSKKKPGTKFPDYYAIFLNEVDGELRPVTIIIDGKPHSRSVKCHISDNCMKKLTASGSFPFDVSVDDNRREREGEADYILTIDKDSVTKKPRLDKNGNSHYIIILQDFLHAVPTKSFTIDDFLKEAK